jgi:hypothetical protein
MIIIGNPVKNCHGISLLEVHGWRAGIPQREE